MSKLRVYIKPFVDDVGSAYETDWREITDDVVSMGDLSETLDNTDQDVGIFRAANVKLSLRNDTGRYNDVGDINSIFKYKRSDSLIKFTWEPGDHPLVCGMVFADDPDCIASEEVDLFEGMLSDLNTQSEIDDLDIDFQVMGYDQLLSQMIVPFSDLSNGDTVAQAIYDCLNQAPFNERVTVSSSNIATGVSVTIDDVTDLETKTVLEALKIFLAATNSVLYLRDGVVYVSARTASTDLEYTFYGPGASDSIENIADIKAYKNGVHRIRNYWTWKDTVLVAQDATSIDKYGYQKKEISFDMVTDNTKRTSLLTGLKNEFADKKREFQLDTPMNDERLALYLLDKVSVDYPSPSIPTDENPVAIYGIGEYGTDYYADTQFNLTIESTARFKIMSRKLNFKNETISYGMREV